MAHEFERQGLAQAAEQAWGWEIPVYLFLGGAAAGVMIASSLLALRGGPVSTRVRLLAFAAPILVSVGMGALLLDLSYKLHVLRFYAALRWTSPMSWGAWILVLVYPVTIAFGLSPFNAALARFRRPLAVANLALGAGLGVYTGILLSTLVARPLWNSALLGPLFLASGASSGMALLLLFRLPDSERHALARWDLCAIGAELALIALFLLGLASGGESSAGALALILGGRYTAVFWSLVIVAGLLVPFALDALSHRVRRPIPAVAPVLVLVGGFALRWILVSAGQA